MSTYVDKIIFRGNETYKRFYQGNQLLFEIKQPEPVVDNYLAFEYEYPNDSYNYCRITYHPSTVSSAEYSFDKVNWSLADNVSCYLNRGEKVYFRGFITGNQSTSDYASFSLETVPYGKIYASGSIMSLQAGNPEDKTILYNYEFYNMFYNTVIQTAPELPATTLSTGAYSQLFYNCKYLKTAPELPSLYLPLFAYNFMFAGCRGLNHIKAMFLTNPTTNNTASWLGNVAETGTFIKNKDATWDVRGENGIPDDWTVETA